MKFNVKHSLIIILIVSVLLGTELWMRYKDLEEVRYFRIPTIKRSSKLRKTSSCRFRTNMKSLLLAINFNFPVYDVIPLLKEFYNEQIFGKVVFCGSKKSQMYGDVIQVAEAKGYQGYFCLNKAIETYPGYDGYIYSNDDLLLNYWTLNHNITEIWFGSSYNSGKGHVAGQKHKRTEWHWWTDTTQTAKRCEKAFNRVLKEQNTTLKDEMEQFRKNIGWQRKICIGGRSDFFYVPKNRVRPFQFLSSIYFEEKVFLEVAVPTILTFLADYKQYTNLHGVYYNDQYGYSKEYFTGEAFFNTYSFNISFSHPFKLHKNIINQKFLKDVVIPYGRRRIKDCEY